LPPALVIGIASVLAPLFIPRPALGAGVSSTKTAHPLRRSLKSLLTHTVYGFGLYLAALVTKALFTVGS